MNVIRTCLSCVLHRWHVSRPCHKPCLQASRRRGSLQGDGHRRRQGARSYVHISTCTSAFEDLVSAVKFGTDANAFAQSGPPKSLCDTVRFLKEHAPQPADAAVASATELSQVVTQVAEAVREVRASTSQHVRVSDHLGPMDRLEVEPTSTNGSFGDTTTPGSRACHRAKAPRVRLNSLLPCVPLWWPFVTNHTRTSPGSLPVGDAF